MPVPKQMEPFHELAVSGLRTYGPKILQFLKSRWPSPHDWDDLMQEVRLRLLGMPADTIVKNPLAYLYTVASHVLCDWHQRETRRRRVVVDSEAIEEWAHDPDNALPDEMAELLDRERRIEEALKQLPPREAEALKLECEGVPRDEIAERMGLTYDTVEKYINRGMARIRLLRWDI